MLLKRKVVVFQQNLLSGLQKNLIEISGNAGKFAGIFKSKNKKEIYRQSLISTQIENLCFRRAILMLEACKVAQYPFTADQSIIDLDWEVFLKATAQYIVAEQTPKQLQEVRGRLYELLTHCIPADVIFV